MNENHRRIDRRTCLKSAVGVALGAVAAARVIAEESPGDAGAITEKANPDGSSRKLPSLKQSMQLAGQNMLGLLDPDCNYLPYWELKVTPKYEAKFKKWWTAHNIGRWLDAMFRLEEAIGFEIPAKIVEAMSKNTRVYFDNPDHICLCPDSEMLYNDTDKRAKFWDLHSLREGMLGLNALARWRKDEWAVEMGRKMIASVDAKLNDDGTWDIKKFDASQRGPNVIHNLLGCDTHGRMLEAVIWFHETTGDLSALRFADRLAKFHLANTATEDGTINPAIKADHTHSYFGTLRGLLLYGQLTNQRQYIDRVAKAYQVTIPNVVHESGYTSHNMVHESIGETTSPGDATQIALWLSRLGYSEFLDDAERLVRARLLPSQIIETPPLTPLTGEKTDALRDLSSRVIGAYGGCHGRPHSHKLGVTDVTAATLHSLIDVYQHTTEFSEGRLTIRFHFDYEDDRVKIASQRANQKAELQITTKVACPIAIRVPKFAPRESIRVRIGTEKPDFVLTGNFLQLGQLPAGANVTMSYALPERQTRERGQGTDYEIHWRGDDVVGVSPNDDFYPFYPTAPG